TQSVLWGGIANLSTMFGEGSRVAFNGMYSRTADDEARVESGHFENEGVDAKITRMDYVQRAVGSAQATGEHEYGAHRFDWAVPTSTVGRDEPDRSEFVQIRTPAAGGGEVLRWLSTGTGGAVRTFSALDEHSLEGKGDYQLALHLLGREHLLK